MNYFSGCVFALALVFVSCKQASKQKTPTEFTHQHGEEVEEIVLNNGKKWHVDSVMMLIIKDMNQSVVDFKGTSVTAYKQLGNSLLTKINLLTSSCTMQGKAHDELHKWLVPFIDLVGEFSEIKSIEEGKKHFSIIQKEFKRFDVYFE